MKKLNRMILRTRAKLLESAGLSDTTEKLLWALGVIVIVGIVIAFVIAFLNDSLLPEWGQKIMEILNLGGGA